MLPIQLTCLYVIRLYAYSISIEWKERVQATTTRLRAERKEKLSSAAAEGGTADGTAAAVDDEDTISMGSSDKSSSSVKTRILPSATTITTEPSPPPRLDSSQIKGLFSKILPSSSSATKPTSASSSATIDLYEHDITLPMAAIDSDSPPFADDYAMMDVETQPSSTTDEAQKGEADGEGDDDVDVLDSLYNAKGVPSRGEQYFDPHNKGPTSTDDSQGETKDEHAVPPTTTSTTGSIIGLIKQAAVAGIGLGNKVLDLFSSPTSTHASAPDSATDAFKYTVDDEEGEEGEEDIGIPVNPPRPIPTQSHRIHRTTSSNTTSAPYASDVTTSPQATTTAANSDRNLRQLSFTASKVQCDNSDETKKHSEKKKHKKMRAEKQDDDNTIDCRGSQDSTRAHLTPPPDSFTSTTTTNTNNVYTEEDNVNSSNKKQRKDS